MTSSVEEDKNQSQAEMSQRLKLPEYQVGDLLPPVAALPMIQSFWHLRC